MSQSVARDFMTKKLITLRPDQDVFAAIALLLKHRISGAPVVNCDGELVGVFSEKCCMNFIVQAAHDGLPSSTVGAFMEERPQTIEEDTDLLTIAHIFSETPRRRLPVMRDGKLVGQVSRRDVIRAVATSMHRGSEHASVMLYLSAARDGDFPPVA